jgi:isochorismate hydrolase
MTIARLIFVERLEREKKKKGQKVKRLVLLFNLIQSYFITDKKATILSESTVASNDKQDFFYFHKQDFQV